MVEGELDSVLTTSVIEIHTFISSQAGLRVRPTYCSSVHRVCAQLFVHPSLQATARSLFEQAPKSREPGERAG